MSTTSENAGRTSLSDNPHDAIALFDLHLKFLTESYLGFFQERKRIEEVYVESLLRLHTKAKAVDVSLDFRADSSTTRAAWGEVRDNVAREAEVRVAFLGTITTDIITPLSQLRETQDRIKKRIKEDLKDAITTHTEYADNVLPRLKRHYLKKCQEVEEYKAAAAILPPTSPTLGGSESHHAPLRSTMTAQPRASREAPVRPVVTAPQPLRPLDRRQSLSGHAASRARSPSNTTSLQDLAHSGKRQLNQLITSLGGNERLSRSDNALRSVKAKREADEADREYRKGVHWLETLRLRRIKLLEAGYNSVQTFVRESADTVKTVLEKYSDNLIATALTHKQIHEYGARSIERISSMKDAVVIGASIQRMLNASIPRPIFYHNYAVGECRDLIFGVTLVDYATARNLPESEVPRIVKICVTEIEKRGLHAEGIYRVSGRHAAVQGLQHKIERDEMSFQFNPTVDDVYAIASLLKLYVRELPEPIFRFPLHERIQHSEDIAIHISNNFLTLRSKIRRLPPVHQATLKMIVEHLARVASHQEKNKMDAKNLAIVFGVFGEDDMPKAGASELLQMGNFKDSVMEDMINYAHILFQSTDSPPLPPAPLDEAPHPVTYGSTHTRVSNMPPPPPSPRELFAHGRKISTAAATIRSPTPITSADEQPSQDFMPQMPARPAGSIHPSLRAGPMSSPSRQTQGLPQSARSALLFDDDVIVQSSPAPATLVDPADAPGTPSRSRTMSLPVPWADDTSSNTGTLSTLEASQDLDDGESIPEIPVSDSDPEESISIINATPDSTPSASTFESAMSSTSAPTTATETSLPSFRLDLTGPTNENVEERGDDSSPPPPPKE